MTLYKEEEHIDEKRIFKEVAFGHLGRKLKEMQKVEGNAGKGCVCERERGVEGDFTCLCMVGDCTISGKTSINQPINMVSQLSNCNFGWVTLD